MAGPERSIGHERRLNCAGGGRGIRTDGMLVLRVVHEWRFRTSKEPFFQPLCRPTDPAKRGVCTRHALHPVATGARLPSSKRAVSILRLWCTLNACMSMVGLHWDNFWEDGGQHGQESEEGKKGKEGSQEDGQEENVVIVRRNLIAFG
jgi:hypothetical protein